MRTKLHYVLSIAMFLYSFSGFGQTIFLKKTDYKTKTIATGKHINPEIAYEFNYSKLSKTLSHNNKNTRIKNTPKTIVSFPDINGNLINYNVTEASVMHPDLQAKYPNIRTYIGHATNGSSSIIRFSLSPYKGLTGIVLGNKQTLTYKPDIDNPNIITVQNKTDLLKNDAFHCKTINSFFNKKNTLKSITSKNANDSQKRTYKIALSVTGEYANYHGGSLENVNAALVATLTNINAVFENDFNTSLQLVANNDDVIFLDPQSDPYSNTGNYNNELQTTLDNTILDANYDIGHLLAASGFDGNSGCVGCVCISGSKGSAFTSNNIPSGFNFDIDLVAHEIGHQFGANHTWTYSNNEGENVQMEPGSGSTIMGYAGITGSTNVQSRSDPYFHAISIEQIMTYLKSTSCAITTHTGNTTPVTNAGNNLTLPISTPFKLIGTGSDADGDIITYCWEQINEDNAATTYPNPNSTNSNSILFRSYSPTTNNTRYFPNLSDLKFGINTSQWEKIPNVSRTADFRLTIRDNKAGGGNNSHDDMQVLFDTNYGPFEITSQNTSNILWQNGTTETITWNVNNTNNLAGAENVNILLSIDGGATYNTIVNNIPNNGSYTLTIPNTPAPYCRLMIAPTNNNFFAINTEDFAIDYTINTKCTQYHSDLNLDINITDNGGFFTENHTINIPDSNTITDVNIGVDLTHSYIGDLALKVLSPNNTETLLKNLNDCSAENNIQGIFNDNAIAFNCNDLNQGFTYKSLHDLLSNFNGENSAGNWTIQLGDYASGDSGILHSWYVEICQTTLTSLSTEPTNNFNNFKIFPNPNQGVFTIQFNGGLSNTIEIIVFDLRGRIIYKNNFNDASQFNEKINLNHAETGLYILNISNGIKKITKKIIVK